MMRTAISLTVLGVILLQGPGVAQTDRGPLLGVRKVVLYKHGVGYFEREGIVEGDGEIRLGFRASQMKDVLKSLYAVDLSGGRIATISYDTKDPLSKQLEDILIEVPDQNALSLLLARLKGASVEVTVGGETTRGSILGIEPFQVATDAGTTTATKLVLLSESGAIRPTNLLEATSVRLLDPALQADLERMLRILLRAKHADRKTVVLQATGQGIRTVRAGYIVETPIWKTSYRVLFRDEQDPLFQGWAIVENTTDEDWKDVDVSFVAGSPVSFVMDLYTAYYPARVELAVGLQEAPTPEFAKRGVAPAEKPMPRRGRAPNKDADGGMADEKAMEVAVTAQAVGELFAYHSKEPVSVARGQAALIPIVSEAISGSERPLHYRPGLGAHPMNAWHLVNGTKLTLEAGPVTFFEGATCIGESLLSEVLKPGMDAILDYAVEAGVDVERTVDRRARPATMASIADGILTVINSEELVSVYTVTSHLAVPRRLFVDHPSTRDFTLVSPESVRQGPGFERFVVNVPAGGRATLTVLASRTISTRFTLLQTPAETITLLIEKPFLSEATREFLREVIALQGRVRDVAAAEQQARGEMDRLTKDQARTRQNLQVLKDSPQELELRARYLERLEAADARIVAIVASLEELQTQRGEAEKALADKVRSFRDE